MNIWKRFLSLALVLALVLSMGPIIPFVQANAETATTTTPAEMVWNFDDGTAENWAKTGGANGFAVTDGKMVWTSGKNEVDKYAANNGQFNFVTGIANYQSWNNYILSADVVVNKSAYTANGGMPMVGLAVLNNGSDKVQVRIRPDVTANKYTVDVRNNAGSIGGTSYAVQGNSTSTDPKVSFHVDVHVVEGEVIVYIDGCRTATVAASKHGLAGGGVGIAGWTSGSTTTYVETIEIDNVHVQPADNEVLIYNDGSKNVVTSDGWRAASTAIADKGVCLVDGTKDTAVTNYYNTVMTDGWIKADITLPKISATELQTNAASTGAMFYGVRMCKGDGSSISTGNAIEADIWYQRNTGTTAASPKTGTTTLRVYMRGVGYTNGALIQTALPSTLWTTGATVSLELRKVGNYIEVKLSCDTIKEANITASCTVDYSKFAGGETGTWHFGLYADNPLLYTDWTLANKVNGAAYFNNIEVGRINKTVDVTSDTNLVTLPVVKEYSGSALARTAYQVGETIALTVTDGYDVYANGEKIADPAAFVIPNAETVVLTVAEQEIPPVSATYADGVYEAGKWTTASTSAYVSEAFANGYIEVEYAISGEIKNAANMFVRSPKNANGSLFGLEEEIMLRWTVVADTSKAGYTHKATSALVIRDNNAPGYQLEGANSIHGTSKTVYLNIQEGAPAVLKVKMEVVGNLLRIYVNDVLHQEATFDPQYRIASQAGYFGYYGLSANATVTSATVQEVKAYAVTVPENVVADETAHLIKPYSTYGSAFGRSTYVAGETVTLKLDENVMDSSSLKVNGGAVEVTGSNGTYTFTMPAEAVTVTCDKLVMYAITESLDDLSVDKTEAPAGATVTITLDETKLDGSTLKVNDGAVAVSGSNGTYTFTMPAEAVTITCDVKQLPANEELYNSTGKTGYATTDGWNRNGTFADTSTYIYNTLMTEGAISVSFDMPEAALDSYSANPSYNVLALLYNENGTAIGRIEASLYLSRLNGAYDYSYIRLGFRDTEYGSGINARKDITVCSGTNRDNIWGQTVTITLRKVGNYVEATFSFSEKPSMNKTLGWVVTETMENTAFKFQVNQSVQPATISDISVNRINKTASVVIDSDLVMLPTVYQFGTSGPTTTVGVRNAYQVDEVIALGLDPTADVTTLKANGVVIADHEAFVIPNAEAVTITCNKLTLDDNQTLYSYNGTGALPTDLWSAAGTLTDNKLTTVTSKYNTAIEDGWISATVKMPETLPTGSTQVVIEAIEPTSKLEIEFGFLGGANYRAYIRRGNVDTNYAVSNNSFMVFPVGQTSVGNVAGKEVTLSMRKVGNYFELHIYCEGVIDATHGFTMGDITAADGTVLAAIDDAKFNFGVSFPAFGGMTVESIEIGRMNEVATVTVDADSKDLIKVPQFKDPKDTKVLRDRTAYQIGETIALTVAANAKNVKANGVAVANTAAFEITENVVLTATLDKDPYYVATDAIVQYNPAGTAGGTKEWKLLAADYTATIATGYVVSTNITVYTQQKANGTVMNNYPWHGVEVNAVDFRVRPSSDATNSYYIGIRFGGAWVASDDGVVAAAAMTSKVTIPGEKLVGADNEVTYNQAIKVENGVYTLYINGCAVCTYTNATATKGNVRVWSAKNGTLEGDNGNTWGFKVEYADMRIDRIGSVEEVTFGQKQLALDEDLAMDFYIALPTDTTATTATITLGGKEIAVVDLTDAERKPLVDSNMVGWYSWYVVTANVPVKEANSNIVVTLNDGSSKTYSVKEYLDYIMNSDAPEYAAAKATAQSLLDYSATAASYFADRTGAAELPAELAARLENVTIADTYKPTRAGVNEYVSLYGCSLEAVEKANICIYFKVGATYEWSNEAVTVKIGDTAVDNFVVEDAGNGYKRVKITGIHAADLDVVYTVSVAGLTINYSGLSYAYTALNSNTSDNLKTMAKALYSYWAAAQAMN